MQLHRRQLLTSSAAAVAALACPAARLLAESPPEFAFKYMLPSCMYGYTDLSAILPEVAKIGAKMIDIWPKVHGNQREQLDELGEENFAALLKKHDVGLGCITQYKLGPFKLQDEMKLAKRLGCRLMVTGGEGPVGLMGSELKKAVGDFCEKMKPHLAVAEETHVTIAIENHAKNLIDSLDSLRWLAELRPSKNLAMALGPYHLPQDEKILADLIRELGGSIAMFYAWQHGNGAMQQQPKDQEVLQMPGRGKLDFVPIVKALRDIRYAGWTEIFMHPFPRGIPILETTDGVTAEINRARGYLSECLKSA